MALSNRELSELYQYFTYAGRAQRSIQGPILDKMKLHSVQHKPVREEDITAWPTAETREVSRVEPDGDEMRVFGRVSRKLSMLSARNRQALESLHGDEGAVCAERSKRYGRIVSLFRFTEAGKKLIKSARASSLKLSTDQLIQNVVGKQELQPSEGPEKALLAEAFAQACALKEKAEDAYAAAGKALGEEAPKPPKLRLVVSRD